MKAHINFIMIIIIIYENKYDNTHKEIIAINSFPNDKKGKYSLLLKYIFNKITSSPSNMAP